VLPSHCILLAKQAGARSPLHTNTRGYISDLATLQQLLAPADVATPIVYAQEESEPIALNWSKWPNIVMQVAKVLKGNTEGQDAGRTHLA
jgi:hypothetical protein